MKICVIYPIGSDVRLIHLAPGADPTQEPLLSQAGLVWEEGEPVSFTLDGLKGPSDRRRQFVTNIHNDMTPELLSIMVERFNDPNRRPARSVEETRVETIQEDLDKIPEVSDLNLDDLPEP